MCRLRPAYACPQAPIVVMSDRVARFATANPYETRFGYSRAVRRGPFVFVSGTTSIDPVSGVLLHPHSAHAQAIAIFAEIVRAVEAVGATRDAITRVRMFVREDEDAEDVGRALKEALGDVGPAATMIIGARFVAAEMKVEIEADAVVLTWCVRELAPACLPTELFSVDCGGQWLRLYVHPETHPRMSTSSIDPLAPYLVRPCNQAVATAPGYCSSKTARS